MPEYTFTELKEIAQAASESGLFGERGGKVSTAQAFIRILHGVSLGISPTNALVGISIIKGQLVFSAALTAILLAKHGYSIVHRLTDESCTMSLRHDDSISESVTFSLTEAQRAGLVREDSGWKKWPQDMMWARCLTRIARREAAHIFGGAGIVAHFGEGGEPEVEREDTPQASEPMVSTQLADTLWKIDDAMAEKGYSSKEIDRYRENVCHRQGAESPYAVPQEVWDVLLKQIPSWPQKREPVEVGAPVPDLTNQDEISF